MLKTLNIDTCLFNIAQRRFYVMHIEIYMDYFIQSFIEIDLHLYVSKIHYTESGILKVDIPLKICLSTTR